MAKSLVIVESPTKARTIERYLGKDYRVKSSRGHVKDLPRKHLGVDVDKGFQPTYYIIPGKEDVVTGLRKAAQKADAIYLAADPDREGEAICAHLKEILTEKKLVVEVAAANSRGARGKAARGKVSKRKAAKKKSGKKAGKKAATTVVLETAPPISKRTKIFRVAMNEITKRGVQQAFANPAQIDLHLVDAQQARRILDRLVGYEVSPILWDKVKRGLSAGRVQTVALRIVVEREREIRAFKPEEYWTILANLAAGEPPAFDAKLIEHRARKLEVPSQDEAQRSKQFYLPNEEEAKKHVAALEAASFIVESVQQKERRRSPVPPFTTSKLQQESARKLRFSVKRTMVLAQRLYEGKELGAEGSVGLITYMRTDSTRVSQDALNEVRALIPQRFGPAYLPEKPRFYRARKDAQEAHEAIRPTSVHHTPEAVRKYLPEDEFKLYQLIWRRFVASQMNEAVFDQTTIDIRAGDYRLRATGSVMKFDGFLAVYEEGKDEAQRAEEEEEARAALLPAVREGETLRLNQLKPEQHFTQPPPRYTDASLVKELEEKGIGRPSTYASIISTILDRDYVGKQKGRLFATQLGELVSDLLIKSFDDIFDIRYTARMEEELDEIEEGKLDWRAALDEFYEKFARDLERAGEEMENVKAGLPTEETCERCGKPMLLRIGRHGLFLACSGYPECTNTREPELDVRGIDSDDTTPESETQYCENCSREMVIKRGRYGAFYACSGYPDCKTTKPLTARGRAAQPVLLQENCPDCGGQLQEKFGRYGPFIACSNFPECRYTRQKTLGIKCPECGQGELSERRARRGGRRFYGCSRYPECKFTVGHRPLAEPCPQCGAALTYEKRRKGASAHYCRNPKCNFEQPLAVPTEEAVAQEAASSDD
ncbi:MAG: type I DNA topoisomerase [Terriglobia bacterium]